MATPRPRPGMTPTIPTGTRKPRGAAPVASTPDTDSVADQNCTDCRNFVPDSKLVMNNLGFDFGKGVGYCAARFMPLNRPGATQKELDQAHEHFAVGCTHYKVNAEPDKNVDGVPVFLTSKPPKPGISERVILNMTEPVPSESQPFERPDNCASCQFSVSNSDASRLFGWPVTLCAKQGFIIPPSLRLEAARSCTYGVRRTGASLELETLVPVPVYGKPKKITPFDSVDIDMDSVTGINPAHYETDRPVEPHEAALGIRAWRRFKTRVNRGDDNVDWFEFPIFDVNHWEPEIRALVPQFGDKSHPELYLDENDDLLYEAIAASVSDDRVLILTGEPGTGKTQLARYAAYWMQLPLVIINMRDAIEVEELVGMQHVVPVVSDDGQQVVSVTEFVPGVLTRWSQRPSVIVADELNAAPDSIWHLLRGFLEGEPLELTGDKGQLVHRHQFCYTVGTQNPAWDPRNTSVRDLASADIDRLLFHELHYPSEETERQIIVSQCAAVGYRIQHRVLDPIMKISEELRKLTDPQSPELMISWGVRTNVKVALATRTRTMSRAYLTAIGDQLSPDDRQIVMTTVNSFLPDGER